MVEPGSIVGRTRTSRAIKPASATTTACPRPFVLSLSKDH